MAVGPLIDISDGGQGLSTSEQVILHHRTGGGGGSNDLGVVEGGAAGVGEEVPDGGVMANSSSSEEHAFEDAKRKLRLMLSEADLGLLASLPPMTTSPAALHNRGKLKLRHAPSLGN